MGMMCCCGGKKKEKKEGEEDEGGKCVISPNMMKLVTLITLLVSDFDMIFTIFSLLSYANAGGIFFLFIGVICFFFCVYIGGCTIAAKEANKFLERFKDKVRLNEINGISMEDLEDALNARRIFWTGPEYESAKKRKSAVEQLKQAAPEASEPIEIDIPTLEMAVREAELVGVPLLHMPGDRAFGLKAMARANGKLKAAKKAQAEKAAMMLKKRASSGAGNLGAKYEGDIPDDAPEPHYKPNKARSRDAIEGRGGDEDPVDVEGLADDAESAEEDFALKIFEEEIKVAEAANDPNVVKLLQLAMYKHIDSYKVPAKLLDKKGKITDPLRALYMICEAKGILHSYHQASRTFARRIVKPSHSTPYYRLMEYGWQPSVSHTDFAGILNANALYSFTVGFPQLFFSLAFIASAESGSVECEAKKNGGTGKCTITEDFQKPTVQLALVVGSLAVGIISLIISIVNIVVDFPAQLFDIAEKEDESLAFTLQAEHATKTWEDKLAVEVQENVKIMLKKSTQFEDNMIKGMEAPSLVIGDVMALERAAMEKKVAYIEHFLTMSEDEKKLRNDLREGKRKKKGPAAELPEPEAPEAIAMAPAVEAAPPQPMPPPARLPQPAAAPAPPPKPVSVTQIEVESAATPPPTTEAAGTSAE